VEEGKAPATGYPTKKELQELRLRLLTTLGATHVVTVERARIQAANPSSYPLF
jgi:hypothetical protein